MLKLKLIYISLSLLTHSVFAQSLLVKAGYVLDLTSGIWKKNQTLLVENGRIVEINPKMISSKWVHLDLSKHYLIPGLIDAHTHLFLDDSTLGENFSKGLLEFYKKMTDEERHELASQRSFSLVKSGFTAVRDLGNSGPLFRSHLKHSAIRFYSSGPGHTPKYGQFPKGTAESIIFSEYSRLDSTGLKALTKGKRTTLKLYADEDPNSLVTDSELIKKWTKKGKELGLKVAIHAILQPAIQVSIDAGADSIEHGTFATQDQYKQMAAKKIAWVPSTGSHVLTFDKFKDLAPAHIFYELKNICRNIQLAHKSGVKIVFGSDYYYSLDIRGMSFGEATLEALLFLNQCGLSSFEVIKTATLNAAELLGSSDVGQLNKGSWADFIVLKDDPLANLSTLKSPLGVYFSGKKRH